MPLNAHLGWLAIVACLALFVLFGAVFLFDDACQSNAWLPLADRLCGSPDETLGALPREDDWRPTRACARGATAASPALRAVVPGGLCLLI